MAEIERRNSVTVNVGGVPVGGGHAVVVQAMTNTDTADASATAQQIVALARAGAEIVRITVNNRASAAQVAEIVARVREAGLNTPVVGDFHYNGHLLLAEFKDCARALAKYRINPGNVGAGKRHDENFRRLIELALEHDKPVRIGVNWGSLDQSLLARLMDENARRSQPLGARAVLREAIITSALESAQLAESYGLSRDRIILSAKCSEAQDLIDVYRQLAQRGNYALHLGLTEAGLGTQGVVASAAALAVLLQEGLGDTLRVSLTPAPNGERTEEVIVAQQILQSLGIRHFTPQVTACPGCGRTTSTLFQELAAEISQYLRAQMPVWRTQFRGVEELKVAVMGCIVNGPGESKQAHIGISLPGTGEEPRAPVFIDGKLATTLKGPQIAQEFIALLQHYVAAHYAPRQCATSA